MKLLKQLCILVFCFFLYLCFGALVFHQLEGDNEARVRVDMVEFFRNFRKTHTCIEGGELKALIVEIIRATENGVFHDMKYYNKINDSGVKPSEYMQWDIFNSFFFSSTVVTTIGYGNLSPKTLGGRTFCIIYALIGIPLTGWMLNVVGRYFVERWNRLAGMIMSNLSTLVSSERARKYAAYVAVGCLMYTLTIIIPSLLFMYIENWTFFQAQYFCLISLTTIGFGDFVICNDPTISVVVRATYKLLAVVYLIFGLGVVMISLKCIGEMETKNAKTFGSLSQKLRQQVLSASDRFRQRNEEETNQLHDNNNNGTAVPVVEPSTYRASIYSNSSDTETPATEAMTTEHV